MSPTIELTDADSEAIEQFVQEMLDAGKSSKTDDFEEAYTRGKGAEVAVSRFLNREFDLSIEVDFDVYEGADSTDLPPYQAEVKVLPSYGKWCAIPERQFSRIENGEPIILVKEDDSSFEIAGWTLPSQLSIIEQGAKPFTQFGDNYCKRIANCSTDWSALVEELTGEPQQQTAGDTQRGGTRQAKFDFFSPDDKSPSTKFNFSD